MSSDSDKKLKLPVIIIPYIFNTIRKGELRDSLVIDFNNAHKNFKSAKFEISKISGNTWRIGLLLLGDNGLYFIFHPYIDNKNTERLSLAFVNEVISNKTKLIRKVKRDLKVEELREYQIIKKDNIISCFINGQEKRYENTIEEIEDDKIHRVRFQFWRHDNEEIALELKNFELRWE